MKPKFFQIMCIFVAIWFFNGCYYPSGISKAEFRQLPRYLQHKYQGKRRKNAFSVDTFYCIMVNEGLAIPY
ncbi:MAG TPA: hypothetical protein PKO16_09170, partial [Bacteroidia bacterium]|nr:hypothetical protein [Bacteroidia bacterium]